MKHRHPYGIPTELTSFVGRGPELEQVAALVARSRLVTLTGAGGSGKTRLALALVAGPGWAGAVHWVELAALRDPALVVATIAEALGLGEELGGGGLDELARLLRDHQGLIVLDNCEHLVDACTEVVHRLLLSCPGLAVLATSREALGVPGERAWLVPPLSLPENEAGGESELEAAERSEAVRLFVERARDASPEFALDVENAGVVAEICRRLDGIPLALELAAARVKVLRPADLLARLDNVFGVLTSGSRVAVPRHRTLRATIEWSHDLLREPARALLRRVAVFRGGFGLDGAERVGAGGGIEAPEVLDLVAHLVDRSMLVVREHGGFARYHLLEAVRQYATEELKRAGEEPDTRRRHAEYVLERVEEAEPHLIRRERRFWVERLEPEMGNIRSALAWSFDHDGELHVRLVGKLWWFWFSTRHWSEASRWIRGARALPEAAERGPARAALLFSAGALAALRARAAEARPDLEEAIELAAEAGDARLSAYATNYLGMTYAGEGDARAMELCDRAADWFRAHDDLYGLRLAALLKGSSSMGRGDYERAEELNREGVRLARLFGAERELAVALQNLAAVHITQNRLDEAEALVREALTALRRDPSVYFLATGIAYVGEIAAGRGRVLEAARIMGAAEAARELIGAAPFPLDARRAAAAVDRMRAERGAEDIDRAWADGRGLALDELLDELAGEAEAGTDTLGVGPSGEHVQHATGNGVAPDGAVGDGAVGGEDAYRGRGAGAPETEGSPELRVEALGPLVVHVEGERLEPHRFAYGKPRELLTHLLLNRQGGSRDQIGEALWPGAARSRVKNSFHVTLHHLRKALGHPEWVVLEGERYRLSPELRIEFDVEEFTGRARAATDGRANEDADGDADAIRDALALYRGELLEGEAAGRWIDPHRDGVRRAWVELHLALGSGLESTDPAAAARLYEALAAREELDEEVHRRLMRAWSRSGERTRALRHYERVVELLSRELDAEPEPETRALYEALRSGALSST